MPEGNDNDSWEVDGENEVYYYDNGYEVKNKYGDITLRAIWENSMQVSLGGGTLVEDYNPLVDSSGDSAHNIGVNPFSDEKTWVKRNDLEDPSLSPQVWIYYSNWSNFYLPDDKQMMRPGYTFDGWMVRYPNINGNGNTSWIEWEVYTEPMINTTASVIWGDIGLVASWTPIDYKIMLDLGDNNGAANYTVEWKAEYVPSHYDQADFDGYIIEYTADNQFSLPTTELFREGHKFLGWELNTDHGDWIYSNTETTTDADGNIIFEEVDKAYISFARKTEGFTGFDYVNIDSYGNIHIKAIWELVEYTLTLDASDEYDGLGQISSEYMPGGTIAEDKVERLEENAIKNDNGDIIGYRIIAITYTIEDDFTLPVIEHMYHESKQFDCWALTEPKDSNMYSFDSSPEDGDQVFGKWGNVTLKGIWVFEGQYTITLDLSNGYLNTVNGDVNCYSPTIDGQSEATISGNIIGYGTEDTFGLPKVDESIEHITREGYTFLGWILVENESAPNVSVNNFYTTTKDSVTYLTGVKLGTYGKITLQAQWEVIVYTITMNYSGGTAGTGNNKYEPEMTSDDSKVQGNVIYYTVEDGFELPKVTNSIAQLTKTGYKFIGWILDNEGVGEPLKDVSHFTTASYVEYADYEFLRSVKKGYVGNARITAIWQAIEYIIELNMDGGTFTGLDEYENTLTGTNPPIIKLVNGNVVTIEYTIETDSFMLPSNSHITRPGREFSIWKLTTSEGNDTTHNWGAVNTAYNTLSSIPKGKYGNVELKIEWEIIFYEITLEYEDNVVFNVDGYRSYLTTDDEIGPIVDNATTIRYSYDSANFDLPKVDEANGIEHISRTGYRFVGWTLEGGDKSLRDFICGIVDNITYVYSVYGETTGDATIKAQWEEVVYTITLQLDNAERNEGTLNDTYAPEYITVENHGDIVLIRYTILDEFSLPTSDDLTKVAYIFDGWTLVEGEGNTPLRTSGFEISNGYITKVKSGAIGNAVLQAHWHAKEYSITYKLDGGTINNSSNDYVITYTVESSNVWLVDRNTATKTGYTLNEWKLVAPVPVERSESWGELYASHTEGIAIKGRWGNVCLQAVWSVNIYTITLDFNCYDGIEASLKDYDSSPANITNLIENNVVEIDHGYVYIEYTIDDQFNLPTSINVTRRGYAFVGWTLLGKNITDSSVLFETLTIESSTYITKILTGSVGDESLVAEWKEITYTITLDLNDSNISRATLDDEYSASPAIYVKDSLQIKYTVKHGFNLPTSELARSGYKFVGWEFNSSGLNGETKFDANGIPISFEGTNSNGDTISITFATNYQPGYQEYLGFDYVNVGSSGPITLKAKWQAITYTFTLIAEEDATANDGTILGNYTLSGISTDNITHQVREDGTIYALAINYTIENAFNLPSTTNVSRTGYALSNWVKVVLDGNWAESSFVPGAGVSGKWGNVTFKAQWTTITYYITLDLKDTDSQNSGKVKSYQPTGLQNSVNGEGVVQDDDGIITIAYTVESATLLLPKVDNELTQVTRVGYNFIGWVLNNDGVENPIRNGNFTTITKEGYANTFITSVLGGYIGNAKFKAEWKKIGYTITLNLDGGTINGYIPMNSSGFALSFDTSTNQITYNILDVFNLPKVVENVQEIVKEAYTFKGWTLISGDKDVLEFTKDANNYLITVNGGTGDAVLQANWIATQYIITLNPNGGAIANTGKFSVDASGYGTITYTIEDEISLPTNDDVTKLGYTLSSWKPTSSVNNWGIENLNPAESLLGKWGNITLQANWDLIIYTITLTLDGTGEIGNAELHNPQAYEPIGSAYIEDLTIKYTVESIAFNLPTSNQISKTGYKFLGWSFVNGDKSQNEFEKDANNYLLTVLDGGTGNAKLQAEWVAKEYEIELLLDKNGEVGNANLKLWQDISGGYNPTPATIEKRTVTDSTTGASTIKYIIIYTIADTFNLPKSEISKTGYDFHGWSIAQGGQSINFGQENKYGYFESVLSESIENAKLQAEWVAKEYEIQLVLDGSDEIGNAQLKLSSEYADGYNPTPAQINKVAESENVYTYNIVYTIEHAFYLPTTQIVKVGYTFDGWEVPTSTDINFEKKTGYTQYVYINSGSIGNATIKAVWNTVDYYLYLNLNDKDNSNEAVLKNYNPTGLQNEVSNNVVVDTNSVVTIKYTIEDTFNLPISSNLERLGHAFKGWKFAIEGTNTNVKFDLDSNGYFIKLLEGSVGNNETIYANWSIDNYEISLHLNVSELTEAVLNGYNPTQGVLTDSDASDGIVVIQYNALNQFALPTNEITKEGYKFLGWAWKEGETVINTVKFKNTRSDFEGFDYVETGSVGNASIQAVWVATEYIITLDANEGNILSAYTNVFDSEDITCKTRLDGTVEKVEIKYTIEDTLSLPTSDDMYRKGYNIIAWKLIAPSPAQNPETRHNWGNLEQELELGYEVSVKWGNVELQAKWDLIEYTITLELNNDGEVGEAELKNYTLTNTHPSINGVNITYTVVDNFSLPTGEITKIGYKFLGWRVVDNIEGYTYDITNNQGDYYVIIKNSTNQIVTDIDFGTNSINFEGFDYVKVGSIGDVTVRAIWEALTYTITLNLDGVGEIGEAVLKNYTPTANLVNDVDSNGIVKDINGVVTIEYTIENTFNLPSNLEKEQISKDGYNFLGWSLDGEVDTVIFGTNGGYKRSISRGSYGSAVLQAEWNSADFTIILELDGGKIENYTPITGTETPFSKNQITYTVESVFNLPSRINVKLTGYTVMEWELSKISSATNSQRKQNWGTQGDKFVHGYQVVNKIGDITLKAIWTENTYDIKLHSNNGTNNVTIIEGVKYTNVVQITNYENGQRNVIISGSQNKIILVEWELTYHRNLFVGWATTGYDIVQTYAYIDTSFTENNIVGEFGNNTILKDGCTVAKLTEGDYEGSQIIDIYAIWLPIYTLTIDANGAKVYENGILTNKSIIEVDNHYYNEYYLYSQLDNEMFYTPGVGTRLYNRGHFITGWIIKVGRTQYKVLEQTLTPSYEDWIITTDVTKFVDSGTNMQYLQGDIIATPQWQALEFDVRYETKSSENYKVDYEDTHISKVVYNNDYIISVDSNISIPAKTNLVKATDIKGYSVIYANPYNGAVKNENINTDIEIPLNGIWNYELQYKQYTPYDEYAQENGWYVIVEGYYAPDLYRIKLDLQLPYTNNNDFKLNSNGFDLVEEGLSNLQNRYASKIPSINNNKVEYIVSTNYIERQRKIYKVGNEYYIYLLEDQIVEDEIVYDRYANGKTILNPTQQLGFKLPNFEISYYQMQYYYTSNNESSINLYQIGSLDLDHKENAKQKLSASGQTITENNDWKYSYCNTNEELNDSFAFKVYWYRNIVNIDINNLLQGKDSFNGYALIEEIEQVTTNLQEHSRYHIVIYTQQEQVFTYVTYSFDNISLLKPSNNYEYINIVNLFDSSSVEDLNKLHIIKQTSNVLPIYFGNTFNIQAIDQSKDHSLDEFVGYRFDNFSYSVVNKQNTTSTCTKVEEFDNFVNNGINLVQINLQDYEYGINNNYTNYLLDKDTISIDLHFSNIKYVFRYQVVNNEYNLSPEYGNIRFDYKDDAFENYQFEYEVIINSDNTLRARMNVRLGTELLAWKFVNSIVDVDITEDNSQTCRFIVDATFLRNYLYAGGEYSSLAQQNAGTVNAVCGDIQFAINVNVKDLSNEQIVREYQLSDDEQNKLFEIKDNNGVNANTVSIGNEYLIKMLTKSEGDDYLYYYQNGQQYVVRRLYIGYSLLHSTNLLVNEFAYPVEALEDIVMLVDNDLLDGSVNYIEHTEVSDDNRYLNFYIEIAPTIEISFAVNTNANDRFKGSRQVSIEDIPVAYAVEGEQLQIVYPKYNAYWGQQILFNFVADNLENRYGYYQNAKLSIDYQDENVENGEFSVAVNSNTRYAINGNATVTIELIPQTYTFEKYIEYNEVRYNTNDTYGASGELPISQLVNTSGKNIFDLEKGVELKVDSNNISSTNGIYYSGDKININYTLNSAVANDFEVTLYCNGNMLYKDYEVNAYVAEFVNGNIVLRILVKAKTNKVVLSTDMRDYTVAQIYAQVNDGEIIDVQTPTYTEDYTSINLISGDKLNVYIKEEIGFEFMGKYSYKLKSIDVTQTEATGEFEGFTKITLFEQGFSLSEAGYYYLMFKQIPIDIQFSYYTVIPDVEQVNAGKDYLASSNTAVVQKDSEITITKGNDGIGFRFDGYTYGAPKGEGGKQLGETSINETQTKFTITKQIMEYLSTVQVVDGKMPLIIYVNYVRQYTYQVRYLCNSGEVRQSVTNAEGKELLAKTHYDYGTEMNISIKTVDTKHYKIKAIISNASGVENINTSSISNVEVVDGSVILTNLNNLAGFTINRNLTSNYVITIDTEVECYDTKLNQHLYNKIDVSETPQSTTLKQQGDTLFNLYQNIYYKVDKQVTHQYGTEVKILIYVLNPQDTTKQYYKLSEAKLNDEKLTIEYIDQSEVEGNTASVYSVKYMLKGDNLPTELKLDLYFKALYYVEVKID
ncbi:MAG: InlB B-repeat-containing protein [Clostridia bacterium]|nr:InlB B-repeat-containing protein [Clostridia bacterium]